MKIILKDQYTEVVIDENFNYNYEDETIEDWICLFRRALMGLSWKEKEINEALGD